MGINYYLELNFDDSAFAISLDYKDQLDIQNYTDKDLIKLFYYWQDKFQQAGQAELSQPLL